MNMTSSVNVHFTCKSKGDGPLSLFGFSQLNMHRHIKCSLFLHTLLAHPACGGRGCIIYLLLVVSYYFSLYTYYYSWPSLISLYKDASQRPLVIHSLGVSRRLCYYSLVSRRRSSLTLVFL